jgi:hypothetical protein
LNRFVIASEAKQSIAEHAIDAGTGLPRRFAPRNDGSVKSDHAPRDQFESPNAPEAFVAALLFAKSRYAPFRAML